MEINNIQNQFPEGAKPISFAAVSGQVAADYNAKERKGKHIQYGNGGLWPFGKIYYQIEPDIKNNSGLMNKLKMALEEWNNCNKPHCIFMESPGKFDAVTFKRNDSKNPSSHVGYWKGLHQHQHISLPVKYPGFFGPELTMACILHEMMHTAGFVHEFSRQDRDKHVTIAPEADHNYEIDGVELGQYDYESLMHYCETEDMKFNNDELKRFADKSKTFSAGDLAAIKKIYSPLLTHHGEWHPACTGSFFFNCTNTLCYCGNCGTLKNSHINCGYTGQKGHWTCCMDETRESDCKTTHSGFWHAKCDADESCTAKLCYCGNCGDGCTYEGYQGHWACCTQEDYNSVCTNPAWIR